MFSLDNSVNITQITKYKTHPVRFLSVSNADKLCFYYDGEIYTKEKGKDANKVNISILSDTSNPLSFLRF